MASTTPRSEERIGLAVAIAFHAGLVALLLWRPPIGDVMTPPDRIEVTFSDEVALTSTSPEPISDARADVAPEFGEPAPSEPEVAPEPSPEPLAARPEPQPRPTPRAVSRLAPRPKPRPEPRPTARPTSKPVSRPTPAPRPTARATQRPIPRSTARPGGSQVGSDFLEGVSGARSTGRSRNPPAQAAGPEVRASLLGAISRELKPHWQGKVPEGADSEQLITILRWNLNRDGTLAGSPQLVRQEGITDANRPQAGRHAEQAIRAVQLAAPFELPSEYYDAWKRVTIRFDKRLSQ